MKSKVTSIWNFNGMRWNLPIEILAVRLSAKEKSKNSLTTIFPRLNFPEKPASPLFSVTHK